MQESSGEDAPLPNTSEAAWVRLLQAGNAAAYERLVRTFGPRLLALARRYVPDADDAQDVVQNAFCSAFRSIGAFRGDASLGTWLHRLTVNAALMHLRAERRRPEKPIEPLLPRYEHDGHRVREHGEPSTGMAPALEGLERRAVAALVRDCIAQLPDSYRVVLLLRDVEGRSTEETAAALSLSAAAVKVRLHRGRRALMTVLQRRLAVGV